jgi:translation initiation factor IF-3
MGIVTLAKARETADTRGLDLVEVSPNSTPPVCKIMDFGKYRFEQSKKIKESKKKQTVVTIKEMRLRPKIEEHDYQTKLRQTIGFLKKGFKVKVTLRFRGREMTHQDIGREIIDRMLADVSEVGAPENRPKLEGRLIVTMIGPKTKK